MPLDEFDFIQFQSTSSAETFRAAASLLRTFAESLRSSATQFISLGPRKCRAVSCGAIPRQCMRNITMRDARSARRNSPRADFCLFNFL
jgi:hypothetical protein